jgi:hypothetical protein
MAKRSTNQVRLQLWALDDRIVPATDVTSSLGNTGNLNGTSINSILNSVTAIPSTTSTTPTAQPQSTAAATTTASTTPAPPPPPAFSSFLPDRTAKPQVQIISSTGTSSATLTVFDANYTGGVWTARADVTGDGRADTIAASGPGIPGTVALFNALDNRLVRTITPYESSFTGGVLVAAMDLDGDGRAEIVTGTDKGGGPRVKVYSGLDNSLLADFMAIEDENFRGGVRVSLGDVNGDGTPDLIAAAGYGGGPRVAVFDGKSLAQEPTRLVADFFAFEETLRDGVYVSAGKLDSDNKDDLIFGAGPGGAPRVLGISSARLLANGSLDAISNPNVNFFAGLGDDRGGVRVGVVPNSNGIVDLFTAGGSGGLVQRYGLTGKLIGTVDRELALGGGLLSDTSGQVLTNGGATTTSTGTGTTTPGTSTGTATNSTLQQLLNSLGLGTTATTGTTIGTNAAGSKTG